MRDIRVDLFDVIPYLEDKGVPFFNEGPNVTPGWIELNCLWCSDRSAHLGIHLQSNILNCWRCGKHYIVDLVRALENDCNYSEALAVMEKYQNPSRISNISFENRAVPSEIKFPKYFQKLVWPDVPKLVKNFISIRGFDPENIIRTKELYFGGIVGSFRYRLILPVTKSGKIVCFLGRGMGENILPPYKNIEDQKAIIPVKDTLYGYDECPPGSNIVVVEGPFDQWKLGAGSVCTYGTAWTIRQVSLLRDLKPNKIYILYDTEWEAQEQARKLSNAIWFCKTEIFYLEGAKDPGELTLEEGKKIMGELK